MIFLVEFDVYDTAPRTLYVATHGVRSGPIDTPANQFYSARLASVGRIERSMFGNGDGVSGGTTGGQSEVGFGNISVLNGAPYGAETEVIDNWKNYSFRNVTIRSLTGQTQAFAQAITRFVGACEQLVSTNAIERYDVIIHDRLQDLAKPLLIHTYLGTTTSGGLGTVNGDADLTDQIKQKIWGTVHNARPIDVNHYDLVWQVSDGAVASIAAFDGGIALTLDSDVGNLAGLFAATIAPGHYVTCLALGLLRLGTEAIGGLTVDVVEGATAADRSAVQIAKRMLAWFDSMYGVSLTMSAADVTALDALNNAPCGIVVTDTEAALDAIMRVLNSVGAWMLPQSNSRTMFNLGRLDMPSGPAVASYDFDDAINGNPERIESGDDSKGVPCWKVIARYDQLGVVQKTSELFGQVVENDPIRVAYLGQEWRQASAQNASILTKWPNAPTITVDTRLTTQSSALAEATRLLSIYSAQRDIWRMTVPMSDDPNDDPGIGEVVELTSHAGRMGLGTSPGSGTLYRVIGRVDDFDAVPLLTLTLMGPTPP